MRVRISPPALWPRETKGAADPSRIRRARRRGVDAPSTSGQLTTRGRRDANHVVINQHLRRRTRYPTHHRNASPAATTGRGFAAARNRATAAADVRHPPSLSYDFVRRATAAESASGARPCRPTERMRSGLAVGTRAWSRRMLAVVLAANLVLFPLKLLLLGGGRRTPRRPCSWQPCSAASSSPSRSATCSCGTCGGNHRVRMTRPRWGGANGWACGPRSRSRCVLMFNWLFSPGLMPSRYGDRVKT